MADEDDRGAHLSDADIDAYWTGRLDIGDQERVERHFLECAACQIKVAAVEALIDGLRSQPAPRAVRRIRAWQAAAAVLAVAAAGATWQLARVPRESPSGPPPAPTALPMAVVALAPPTRAAQVAEVTIPAEVSIVVFELDAAEAGAPGSRFDVALTGPAGRTVARLEGLSSSSAGVIRVPIARSLLEAGSFAFDITGASATVTVPFLIPGLDLR